MDEGRSDVRISKRADRNFVEAFSKLVKRFADSVKKGAKGPVAMYVAGGAAMHFYTGARYTDDVDATLTVPRLLVPQDLSVVYVDANGDARSMYFDTSYNDSYALMHADSHHDAMRLPLESVKDVQVYVLKPVDLAVSKLARFGEVDREDILELGRQGLITSKSLRERAAAALPGYVGDPEPVRTSIELACRDLRALEKKR
jgi:hypothetical protein